MPVRKPKTRLIAVEDSLTPVVEALRDKGYAVMGLDEGDLDQVEAVVVSGQDDDIMGIQTIHTKAPVINAQGRSAEEVVQDIEERLGELGI